MSGKIGTHNGKFHCDEVFACWMLKRLPKFKDHTIIRTRDQEELDKCEVVVDVGGIFDPGKGRFDHHQKEFGRTMSSIHPELKYDTRLSSAGLVYAHYGIDVLKEITGAEEKDKQNLEKLYNKLYKVFVESVDAIDNGVPQFDGNPRYQLASTLDSQVAHLNPVWNEPAQKPDSQFQKAMALVGEMFSDRVLYYWRSWMPARKFVEESIAKRKKVHPSGKIMLIENPAVPFKDHFFEIEEEQGLAAEDICLAIFQDTSNKNWRVLALSTSPGAQFQNRVTIPWGGLRDAALEEASGIEGAIFVHVTGFIGGARTKEGALKMAEETLKKAGKLD